MNYYEFPLQMTLVGRTRSGKSYLLRKNILPKIIRKYENVFVFSPTAFLDEGWNQIEKKFKNVILFPEFENDNILQLIEEIGDLKKSGSNLKHLFIFDDITDRLSQSPKSYFSKLAIFGRHYNISYIITSHKFRALNRMIRSNATTKIFFKVNSRPEVKAITDENATLHKSEDDIEDLLEKSTGDYKSFMIKNGKDDDDYYTIDKQGNVFNIN